MDAAAAAATASGPTGPAVARNAVFLLTAYLLPRVLTFGAVVIAARVLGTPVFGAYSTAAAFAVMLSVVATLGMMPLLIREMARSPGRAPSLLRSAHWIKTGTNVVMLAALLIVGRWLLDYTMPILSAALLLGFAYVVAAYVENLAAYFQAIERMDVWMRASAIIGLVWGGIGTILIVFTSSLLWFCVAPLLGQIAGLVWLLIQAPAEVRRGAAAHPADMIALLRALAPFAGAAVALTVYYKVDVLLLALWRSASDVGIYAAAYKLVDVWQALMIVAVSAAYPRLSRNAAVAEAGGRWAATRLTELILLATIPVGAVVWLTRAPIVEALYGAGYGGAIPVVALLALALPALAINILSGYVLASTGRMAYTAAMYAGAVPLNVGLNAALIPSYGAAGAATAMLTSELLLAVGFMALLRARSAAPNLRTAATAAAALSLWGVGAVVADAAPGWVAVCLYIFAIIALYRIAKVIAPDEWKALRIALFPSGNPLPVGGTIP